MANVETTDSWTFGKILKHVILPKPKGSPKAGKKEKLTRAAFFIAFGILGYNLFFGGASLPACNSENAKSILKEAFNGADFARAQNVEASAVIDARELSYDDGSSVRTCSGTLVLNTSAHITVRYAMKMQDNATYSLKFETVGRR